MTLKQDRFVAALPTSKTLTEAALKAGYSPGTARFKGSALAARPDIQEKMAKYGEAGLDRLNKLLKSGRNEIAVAAASKTLIETAYGKPKSNDEDKRALPPINIIFNNEKTDTDSVTSGNS